MTARLESCPILVHRAAPSELSSPSRQNYGSRKCDSSDDKEAYITGSRYPDGNVCFQDIASFGRGKGPHHGGVLVVKQSETVVNCLKINGNYLLYDTTMILKLKI